MLGTFCFHEGMVRRHESRDHRCNELRRFDCRLSCLLAKQFRVGGKVAVDRAGKIDGEFDWLVVRYSFEFQLRHGAGFHPW